MNRPNPDEHAAFYSTYINKVCEGPILDILEDLAETTYTFLSKLTDEQGNYAYAEGKWAIKEVVGHMIDAERTFAYRVLAFSRGQAELPGFDENAYVENATFKSRSIANLAAEFKAVRESNLYLLHSLSEEQQTATGIANGQLISIRALVYILAGHEIHHLGLIKERYLS